MSKKKHKTTKTLIMNCASYAFLTLSVVTVQSLPVDAMRRVEGPNQDMDSKSAPTLKFSQKHISQGVDTTTQGVGVYAAGRSTQQMGKGDENNEAVTHITGQALMYAGIAEATIGTLEVITGLVAKLFGK